MSLPIKQTSVFVSVDEQQLHMRHIFADCDAEQKRPAPILMVHGAIENGRIFYTESGKGLACFLARHGFDVYVMDMRGRGKSTPTLNGQSDYGQRETICTDIPACIDFIYQHHAEPLHFICHSWGGVLVASLLARFPQYIDKVRSQVCFGTKRSIYQQNLEKWLKVDLIWNRIAPLLAKKHGFFDAKRFNIGADSESQKSLADSVAWVKKGPWRDRQDGFDYFAAAQSTPWPATWHLTGINDSILGHKDDVQRFIKECNISHAKFTLLAKKYGNLVDYDHNNILTQPKDNQSRH
ncbi:alpha/beta fold hydrolase [Thalassotalea ponticola]|uniref:alpha/beta fold hydrolase n=1 Tax=Thalassotalea ponticola TaxID=1523392 RepID=UPI0025B5D96F|nr:alpha/beta fold hydrolase [Thalassotalea ponticola]MDN3651797.1 alpha/beta fold hydrolase [Thalassotalea ponticola]